MSEAPRASPASRLPGDAREKLLGAVIGYVATHGFSDLSLREVAAAIGTSHRMLIYHFGSREGLLVAVVQAVEAGARALLAELAADPSRPLADVMLTLWERLADPSLWPSERLFFEIYALALQRRPGTAGFLDDIVDSWVEPMVEYARQRGLDPEVARVDARLAVAVCRGLLLDLLATGDRVAVDAAVERYHAQYEAVTLAPAPTHPSRPAPLPTLASRPGVSPAINGPSHPG
jgi:AcrR family transcriptional regulator